MDSRNHNGSLRASHHQPATRPSYLILPFSVRSKKLCVVDQGVRFEGGPGEPEGIGMNNGSEHAAAQRPVDCLAQNGPNTASLTVYEGFAVVVEG